MGQINGSNSKSFEDGEEKIQARKLKKKRSPLTQQFHQTVDVYVVKLVFSATAYLSASLEKK